MIIEDSFILKTFIKLTSKTYPYGYEDELVNEMTKCGLFSKNIEKDAYGNYFYKVGDSRTIFASHLDTACKGSTSVVHIINDNIIKTDGRSILGADDKAGVTIMLYMMLHNIPGLYYFFVGEEAGCVGSSLASKYGDFKGKYDRIISFDRRGTDSVVTFQSSIRCCSDKFADALIGELNKSGLKYKNDDTGVYTDSAEFINIIPECTNLSVGYYGEHTHNETQDIKHLIELSKACLRVDWEKLPTIRDMENIEYEYWNYRSNYFTTYDTNTVNWRNRNWNGSSVEETYRHHTEWGIKKTRRGNKKKFRKHCREIGQLIEIDADGHKLSNIYNNHYDYIISKFCSEPLTLDELEIVKDQYLDMEIDSDRLFYTYLVDYVNQNII